MLAVKLAAVNEVKFPSVGDLYFPHFDNPHSRIVHHFSDKLTTVTRPLRPPTSLENTVQSYVTRYATFLLPQFLKKA